MAAPADYKSVVQQLYVSYFGRPADYYGLDNFTKQLAAIDTAGELTTFKALSAAANAASPTSKLGLLINSFSGSPEAAALYGTDLSLIGTSKFVAAVYKNILGREADVEGLTFWVNAIQSGALTRANAAAAITEGALSNTSAQGLLDAKTVANKNAVAVNFTDAINTTNEIIGYSGDKAAAAARELLAGVNDTTNVTAFQATVESTLAIIVTGVNAGTTTVLAKGLDNLTGTNGDDTFIGAIDDGNAELNTLSSLDIVTGGAGNDTLKIAHGGTAATTNVGNLTSIETITVESAATNGLTIDTTSTTGVTKLNIVKAVNDVSATAAATTDIAATLKQGSFDVSLQGGKNVVATITDSNNGGVVNVGTTTQAAGTVTVSATGAAAANGANNTLAAINVNGGTSINVTQKAAASTTGLVAGGATDTVTQGAVTIDASAVTTDITVKQDAAVTADSAAAVTGATEVATVKFTALAAAGTVTVGGLTFTAAKALTAAEVAAAFSKLLSGAAKPVDVTPTTATGDTQGSSAYTNGTFSGSLVAGWNSAANVGDSVTFTASAAGDITDLSATGATVTIVTQGVDAEDAVNVLGVVAGVVDISGGAALKTVTVNGYSAAGSKIDTAAAALATLNLSNGGAMTVVDTADTLALTLEKVGASGADAALTFTAAPTTLNVKSVGKNYLDLSSNATKVLNVTGTGTLKADTVALGALETVKVSETAGLTLDATPAATITSVDTTGTTGTVTVTIDGGKAVYTGGAGVDKVTLATTASLTKAIDLGAGDDTLVLGNLVTGSSATLSGGAGTDTLSMTTARADALDATKQTFYTNFERLLLSDAAASTTVDLENLGFVNYVTATGSTGTLTLNNLVSNGTVVLAADNTTGVTVNVKDATTGAADVLNIGLSKATTLAAGVITADKVETVKITGTDLSTAGGVIHTATLKSDTATLLNVEGNAGLTLTIDATTVALATINASTATGKLNVTASGSVAMSITGGTGADTISASQGATAKADVIVGGAGNDKLIAGDNGAKLTGGDGNDIFVLSATSSTQGNKEANTYSIVEDFKAGDLLQLQFWDQAGGAATKDVTSFAKLTASLNPETAVFANFVDAAIAQAGLGQAVWFMFGGSSYVVVDSGADSATTFGNTEDLIIKLTGVNLTDASWNSDFATVSL